MTVISKVSKKSSYGSSSWWMDGWETDIADSFLSDKELKTNNLYKMASHRRAVANFVNIVTNKSIPVKFNTKGNSYTNGKTVTISSKIAEPKEFDSSVGLALHEGSHIKLSNFELLRNLQTSISNIIGRDKTEHLIKLSTKRGVYFESSVKDILNYVEDRRIDQYIFTQAPGYRDYYRAMYDKYFNDPIIEKGLISNEYTDETFASYMFRLINLHSKTARLSGLKSLPKIYKEIDLLNISRLKSTEDALVVAVNVFEIILNSIPDLSDDKDKDDEGNSSQPGDGENGDSDENETGDGDSDENETGDGDSDENGDSDGNSPDAGDSDEDSNTNSGVNSSGKGKPTESDSNGKSSTAELSDRQKTTLDKKIETQKEFIRGNVKKSSVTNTESKTLDNIEEAGADIKLVGKDFQNHWSISKGVDCIVVNKMTESLMCEQQFPLARNSYDYRTKTYTVHPACSAEVTAGIQLGTILGKRLQTRSETKETIYNRQVVGRLDKRMVSSLGFGNEHVFFTREIDKYKKANLHISVDASGSMDGNKWRKTMTNVVALAKAVDMISNLQIQISFRTSLQELPYIVIAYDSRVDKFSKIKNLFQYLRPGGTTPEGLCFEAILKTMVVGGTDIDSYFLNISDGEPYFEATGISYIGSPAAKHTKKMVDKIQKVGIKVLSYFVSDSTPRPDSNSGIIFKESYGQAASFINITNVMEISRTVNKLFMTKD